MSCVRPPPDLLWFPPRMQFCHPRRLDFGTQMDRAVWDVVALLFSSWEAGARAHISFILDKTYTDILQIVSLKNMFEGTEKLEIA